MNLEGTPTAPLTVQCADCRRWIARGTTCQHCWPGHPNPVPEGEHNLADAPPSASGAALARLGYPKTAAALNLCQCGLPAGHSLPHAYGYTAPALPLEIAAQDALHVAEAQLVRIRQDSTCYTDTTAVLERIVALLRGGLGDDHDG